MKKCSDCNREIDKYGIACQYCGKVNEASERKLFGKVSLTEKVKKVGRDVKRRLLSGTRGQG